MADERDVPALVRLVGALRAEKIRFQLIGMTAAIHRSGSASSAEGEEGREINWLPDMDLNHDKQIQSLLCYHYTIGHPSVWRNVRNLGPQSSF